MRRTLLCLALAAAWAPLRSGAWTDTGGGDHDGADWVVSTNTTVGGTHYNVRAFQIGSGVTATLAASNALVVTAQTAVISGMLDANGKGYGFGQGTGAGARGAVNSGAGGGGFGGAGGAGEGGKNGGAAWGSPDVSEESVHPDQLGSGGGHSGNGNGGAPGGAGGGAIKIVVTGGVLRVDGAIRADGAAGGAVENFGGWAGGGGSGGSLWLECGTFAGSGALSAAGGNGGLEGGTRTAGGGGGGGRIAVHYTATAYTGTYSVRGGLARVPPAGHGERGTLDVPPGGWHSQLGGDHGGEDWTVTNNAAVAGTHYNVGAFTVAGGRTATLTSPFDEGRFAVTARTATVAGTLDATGRGWMYALGPAVGSEGQVNSGAGGAGYGGTGGNGEGGKAGGAAWGSPDPAEERLHPDELGSGGGHSGNGNGGAPGGAGGGAVKIVVTGGVLRVDGTIRADGTAGGGVENFGGWAGGGGSGGSLWLECGTFAGSGALSAAGGNGGLDGGTSTAGGGGGGGRIAVHYTHTAYTGTYSVRGGLRITPPAADGDKGTIFVPATGWHPQLGGDHAGADWTVSNNIAVAGLHRSVGVFTISGGKTASLLSPFGDGRFELHAQRAEILGVLDASAQGSRPATGTGVGSAGTVASGAGGGGYGGAGGSGSGGKAGGLNWGIPTIQEETERPDELGSGGGHSGNGNGTAAGGTGGGAIKLFCSGSLRLHGAIRVNGSNGGGIEDFGSWAGGGGAGGSVWVRCTEFSGTGLIAGRGGDGGVNAGCGGGGGGGGRIAIHVATQPFAGSLDVAGGSGPGAAADGAAGTIWFGALKAGPLLLVR